MIPIVLLIPALVLVGQQAGARSAALSAPARVVAGERITLVGHGFPRRVNLQITWNGSASRMPITQTSGGGEVRVRLTVPRGTNPGQYRIAAALSNRNSSDGDQGRPSRMTLPFITAVASRSLASTMVRVTAQQTASNVTPSAVAAATPVATARPTATVQATPAPATPVAAATVAPTPVAVAQAPAPTPAPAAPSGPFAPFTATAGVWLNQAELQRLPTSGAAWNSVVSSADAGNGADISNQDSDHDQATLAAAIYAARTGQQRDRAVAALQSAIGTEQGGRWLAVGRNLTGYIIAADLLGIRSGPIYDWLASFRTMRLAHNNSGEPITFRDSAWNSGSNASAQEGAAYAALAVYLGDNEMIGWSWNAFRRYAGDRTSPHHINSNSDAWQQVPGDPVGIQNAGATKGGCSIDGAISNDMSRGGENLCSPGHTQYPWVGLDGAVPAAMILSRAGYPAWDVANKALRRAGVYLWGLSQSTGNSEWFNGSRSAAVKHLLNRVYGLGYPVSYPVGPGRTFGFTDYTHP
jgi:hypothetical protein